MIIKEILFIFCASLNKGYNNKSEVRKNIIDTKVVKCKSNAQLKRQRLFGVMLITNDGNNDDDGNDDDDDGGYDDGNGGDDDTNEEVNKKEYEALIRK